MYHYLFTNDLRISHLEDVLIEASKCFITETVPTAKEDKNRNNNMNTLGFYFNLTKDSLCAKECANKNIKSVVFNFIKKFQFPNPRTEESYSAALEDGILVAPLRVILQILYIMRMQNQENVYLTKEEIRHFVFFNSTVAKASKIDFLLVIRQIEEFRNTRNLPNTVETADKDDEGNDLWKQCDRQLREMIKILTWSGCVKGDGEKIYISEDVLSVNNKADIYDILTCNTFWKTDCTKFSEIKEDYQKYMDLDIFDNPFDEDNKNENRQIIYKTYFDCLFERNRIVFGAPGTGKSYTLNNDKDDLLTEGGNFERVTFHPDYSYANFVGTYKPVPGNDKDGNETITYEYVPGPFMRILVKALKSAMSEDVKPFLLLVEEINRANVAAVFGDVFQLLDRDDYGVSEYSIATSNDMRKFLAKELSVDEEQVAEIKLPNNMFIWATMNSADQGVFPMDTAFKRRWSFEYIGIDAEEKDMPESVKIYLPTDNPTYYVEWNVLRKAINNFLTTKNVNEDKLMGPFFISNAVMTSSNNKIIVKTIKNKVIMYLFEDAAKRCRDVFVGCSKNGQKRYSEICREFDEKGIDIFADNIKANVEINKVTTDSEGK